MLKLLLTHCWKHRVGGMGISGAFAVMQAMEEEENKDSCGAHGS